MAPLHSAALVSAGWAIVGLAVSARRAWSRGASPTLATPAGSPWRGIAYAFGPGMSPRAKESARDHPVVYAAGVTYHAGVFAALATTAANVFAVAIPSSIAIAAAALLLVASAVGVGLTIRRLTSPLLRTISALDDYAANLLVDAWMLTGAVSLLRAGILSPLLIVSVVLGLYAPLGKIRHCVFFFLSRGLFGARLGHRGIVGRRLAGEVRR